MGVETTNRTAYINENLSQESIDSFEDLKVNHECGVFGIFAPDASAFETFPVHIAVMEGLHAIQSRGESSAGLAYSKGEEIIGPDKTLGKVQELFKQHRYDDSTGAYIGVGHVRYPTTGSHKIENAGPFIDDSGNFVVAHNGNLTNDEELRSQLSKFGKELKGTTDSEVISHLIEISPGKTNEKKIVNALSQMQGSFSIAIMTKDELYAACDRMGNRPLHLAVFDINGKEGYAVSSETPSFDHLELNLKKVIQIKPGEMVKCSKNGIEITKYDNDTEEAFCGLELAYIMRGEGNYKGIPVDTIRRNLGKMLAQKYLPPKEKSYTVGIPNTAIPYAEAYAEEISNASYPDLKTVERTGIMKARYGQLGKDANRGFMQPDILEREGVAQKNYQFQPWLNDEAAKGTQVILIDDSLITGKTIKGVIEKLRTIVTNRLNIQLDPGERLNFDNVHLLVPFPLTANPCFLGVDINKHTPPMGKEFKLFEEIAEQLGIGSFGALTPEEFEDSVNKTLRVESAKLEIPYEPTKLCLACATGKYPKKGFPEDHEVFQNKRVFEFVAA